MPFRKTRIRTKLAEFQGRTRVLIFCHNTVSCIYLKWVFFLNTWTSEMPVSDHSVVENSLAGVCMRRRSIRIVRLLPSAFIKITRYVCEIQIRFLRSQISLIIINVLSITAYIENNTLSANAVQNRNICNDFSRDPPLFEYRQWFAFIQQFFPLYAQSDLTRQQMFCIKYYVTHFIRSEITVFLTRYRKSGIQKATSGSTGEREISDQIIASLSRGTSFVDGILVRDEYDDANV